MVCSYFTVFTLHWKVTTQAAPCQLPLSYHLAYGVITTVITTNLLGLEKNSTRVFEGVTEAAF